jgi:hypothetical protein
MFVPQRLILLNQQPPFFTDFVQSANPHSRKGGLIGLAATAIGLVIHSIWLVADDLFSLCSYLKVAHKLQHPCWRGPVIFLLRVDEVVPVGYIGPLLLVSVCAGGLAQACNLSWFPAKQDFRRTTAT